MQWDQWNTVFEISHHGSNLDGCTSGQLLDKIKPRAFIISAPLLGAHGHPNNSIFSEIVNHCKKDQSRLFFHPEGKNHLVYTNNDNANFDLMCRQNPEPSVDSTDIVLLTQFNTSTSTPYVKDISVTKIPVYTTGSNGTIQWKWNTEKISLSFIGPNEKELHPFLTDDEINDEVLGILEKNEVAPWSFRVTKDDTEQKALEKVHNQLRPQNLQALNLKGAGVQDWSKNHAQKLLLKFPNLHEMAITKEQMKPEYFQGLGLIEKRFYNIS